MYKLERIQKLPISISTAWDFFSNPINLSKITPPYMNFKIIDGANGGIYPGKIISYTVTPILNFKLNWVTEITQVEKLKFFIDEQRFGPYKFWHHKHFLKNINGGVEMTDIVHYKLPMGLLGNIAHKVFVKRKLNEIFGYRFSILKNIFGEIK
ncbi:MAG: SRPBCC family protein [Bacteroidota bacterium]|nr:SRPBCC family protein [Bacteroidota bacterium]